MLKANLRSEKTDRLAKGLVALGISPNTWTLISLVPALAGLAALVMHQLALGLVMFALSAFIDIVDGTVARVTNQVTNKGAYIDGVVDRYVELMLYLGLLIYVGQGDFIGFPNEAWFMVLIFGGLMTSFVRAYADHRGVVKDPRELKKMGGFLERLERLMLLYFGMLLGLFNEPWLMATIVLTAILSNATVLQRIWFALKR